MAGANLTTASTITCTHGGQATLVTGNTSVLAGAPLLLESDVHAVVGCPFTIGPKYSPCVRIEWSGGAANASAGDTAVLVQSSIGKCYSAENAVQGVAIVAATQPRVTSR
jgi:hypothetical protein